jgi:hypothetical protein
MILKYALEGLVVALAASVISRGAASFGEVVLIAIISVVVFVLLDTFAPFEKKPVVGGSHEPGHVGGGAEEAFKAQPDMCGGGLLEALQTAGAAAPAPEVIVNKAVQFPFKMVSSDYGAGVLLAGFNENADGYNADKINELAAF